MEGTPRKGPLRGSQAVPSMGSNPGCPPRGPLEVDPLRISLPWDPLQGVHLRGSHTRLPIQVSHPGVPSSGISSVRPLQGVPYGVSPPWDPIQGVPSNAFVPGGLFQGVSSSGSPPGGSFSGVPHRGSL
jgi:hypothetical protein